jgi:hypothetical protein
VKLIWISPLTPQVDRSEMLLASMASALCVAIMVHLHDVEVSWGGMQVALFLRWVGWVLCGLRLRCERLQPRPRSGSSDAGRLQLDERSPRAVRAFLQHSTLELRK